MIYNKKGRLRNCCTNCVRSGFECYSTGDIGLNKDKANNCPVFETSEQRKKRTGEQLNLKEVIN